MPVYMTGFIRSPSCPQSTDMVMMKEFTEIKCPQTVTNVEIGTDYLVFWMSEKLSICYDFTKTLVDEINIVPLVIPAINEYCKFIALGEGRLSIISTKNVIWEHYLKTKIWNRVDHSFPNSSEYAVKIVPNWYDMLLTNLGRVIIPDIPVIYDNGKYIDILCGLEHTIFLTEDNDVYSMGGGAYGQLGNGIVPRDLWPIPFPQLILALEELKIVQISVGAWHNAAITEQGDLYTWGWNKCGELGYSNDDTEIQSTPKLVRFKDDRDNNVEVNVKKVRCGHFFTICLADDDTLWGTGANSINQLGQPETDLINSKKFIKLNIELLDGKKVKDFKCGRWGTAIITE